MIELSVETGEEDEEGKSIQVPESKTGDLDDQIKELKMTFGAELAEFPHVTEFIERLKTIIRRQQKKLNKFYSKLKDHVGGNPMSRFYVSVKCRE